MLIAGTFAIPLHSTPSESKQFIRSNYKKILTKLLTEKRKNDREANMPKFCIKGTEVIVS